MNATLTMVPVDDIVFDSSQPRKFFDQKALDELTESVKQMGILQPIMVEPGASISDSKGKNRKGYVIICGERRYRAAYAAELKEVPVVIREGLSRSEILEIQITENLQRKDVNPMEEGIAFDQLNVTWSIEEIALRVGKSATYVAQRISLTNLTEDWQQLVYKGTITLTDAYKLARMSKESQDEIFEECVLENGEVKEYVFENMIDPSDNDLAKATFDTSDADLHPDMGSCIGCRFNSASQPLLFEDLQTKQVCLNSNCFTIKTARAYQKTLAEVLKDPGVAIVSQSYRLDKEEKAKIKGIEEMGASVLTYNEFEQIRPPYPLEPFEEWFEDHREFDYDEMDEKEQKKEREKCERDYVSEEWDYKKELDEYNEQIKSATKAFVISGSDEGEIIYIKPKKGKSIAAAVAEGDPVALEVAAIDEQILVIKLKEQRNEELDREKVLKALVEMLANEDGSFLTSKTPLAGFESQALVLAMAMNYKVKSFLEDLLGKAFDYYEHLTLWNAICEYKHIDQLLGMVARRFILATLQDSNHTDRKRYGKAAALYAVACELSPLTVETTEIDQAKKADKRKSTLAARIEALEAKKIQLQEEKARAENEAAGKKAQAKNKKK
jgi:ParB family chromosome partitioning protein